jgi:hypothetical protein
MPMAGDKLSTLMIQMTVGVFMAFLEKASNF